jgi:hypothetical protein
MFPFQFLIKALIPNRNQLPEDVKMEHEINTPAYHLFLPTKSVF